MKNIISDLSPKGIALSAIFGMATISLFLFSFSALIAFDVIPFRFATICALASVFLGALVCSILASGKKQKLLSAVLAGAFLILLMFLLGASIIGGGFNGLFFTFVLIIVAISCIIGSVISTAIN